MGSRAARAAVLLLLVLVTALAAACQPRNAPDPCAGETTLFVDTFEGDPDCGWVQYDDSGLVAEVAAGGLQLTTSQPGKISWTNPGRSFSDVIIEARSRQVSGPNDNAYGVICRYVDRENFYVFLISGDGFYAIGKYATGRSQIQYLTGNGEYVYSDAINQGNATNDIRVTCAGSDLSLAVNGFDLDTVTDDSFDTGDIGLGASTLDPGTAVILFDNVRVSAP